MSRWLCRALALSPWLLLGPLTFSPARQQPAAEKKVRLGTWNIEWLGNVEKRRRPAQKAEDIAKTLIASKVDVLGLNEITQDGDTPNTNKTLTEALDLVKKETGRSWKHLLFPPDDPMNKDQLCGVAWNDEVAKLVDKPFRIPLRRSPRASQDIWRRFPYAVKFSFGDKQTDLVLVPVHMKSNRGGGVTQMSKVRAEEANTLLRSIGAVQNQFSDDDIVTLGDLNCLLRDEPALQLFRTVGFRDLNAADELTWIKDRLFDPAPFDRILVPDEQPEFKGAPFVVFRAHPFESEKDYRERLSDHYLVYTEVRVMEDDD